MSGKKQRDQAAADAEIRKQREQGKGAKENGGAESVDVLGEREDDDVIF